MTRAEWASVHSLQPCADLQTLVIEGAVREVDLSAARRALERIGFHVVGIRASLMARRSHVWMTLSEGGAFSISRIRDAAEGDRLLDDLAGAYFDGEREGE